MLILTTIDDLPPEGIPYITDKIICAGAKNIHILNALTKKGRMEYMILVDFEKKYLEDISHILALEFGTLGMKLIEYDHLKFPYKLKEKKVNIILNNISFKKEIKIKYLYSMENEIISLKAEYEDIKDFAKEINESGFDISFSKIKTIIEAEAYKNSFDNEKLKINL